MGLAVETSAECACPEAPAGAFGRPAARQRTWAGRASDRTPFFARHYDWDGPEQVGKTVSEGGVTASQTQMEYDVAGRLSKVTITTYTSGQASSIVTQKFTYDADGIKVTQTETVDSDADGTADSSTSTEYLNDKRNPTGYSQVLEERVNDGTQTRTTTYTIGHDVIAQFSAAVGALVLLTDAHGSTRAVANAAADVQQQYLYDAYGSLLNMQPANALTSLLYSGEQFNPVAGLQYLRARWYDPSIGRFTRMDPYSGNIQDPLGLHKYTYANGNPVMGVDPTGMFEGLAGLMANIAIRAVPLDTVMGPAASIAQNKASILIPKSWLAALLSGLAPTALTVGAGSTARAAVPNTPVGVGGTVRLEYLHSLRTDAAALYLAVGASLGLGGMADAHGSLGFVWNMRDSSEYAGLFVSFTIPFRALPSKAKNRYEFLLRNEALAWASRWQPYIPYAQVAGTWSPSHWSDCGVELFRENLGKARRLVPQLEDLSISLFGGFNGVIGVAASLSVLSSGAPSLAVDVLGYEQLLPRRVVDFA